MDLFNNVVIDATYKQNNKKCKLTFAQQSFTYFSPMCYGFTKNGPFNEAFDEMSVKDNWNQLLAIFD